MTPGPMKAIYYFFPIGASMVVYLISFRMLKKKVKRLWIKFSAVKRTSGTPPGKNSIRNGTAGALFNGNQFTESYLAAKVLKLLSQGHSRESAMKPG